MNLTLSDLKNNSNRPPYFEVYELNEGVILIAYLLDIKALPEDITYGVNYWLPQYKDRVDEIIVNCTEEHKYTSPDDYIEELIDILNESIQSGNDTGVIAYECNGTVLALCIQEDVECSQD